MNFAKYHVDVLLIYDFPVCVKIRKPRYFLSKHFCISGPLIWLLYWINKVLNSVEKSDIQ